MRGGASIARETSEPHGRAQLPSSRPARRTRLADIPREGRRQYTCAVGTVGGGRRLGATIGIHCAGTGDGRHCLAALHSPRSPTSAASFEVTSNSGGPLTIVVGPERRREEQLARRASAFLRDGRETRPSIGDHRTAASRSKSFAFDQHGIEADRATARPRPASMGTATVSASAAQSGGRYRVQPRDLAAANRHERPARARAWRRLLRYSHRSSDADGCTALPLPTSRENCDADLEPKQIAGLLPQSAD